ncbi:molybdopterin-synthase adenylyltransferase MoeB [Pinirhizobacter sp.]|jgi:molybdopterin/thiamine biosynthesis adenylyltransferase|uniref:molybdopterin-synthase adenylyltransferase MoeB n=1 Tax=Pinirhizobacter sp. TaxID=2950432 RepID=UPI002F41096F
MNQPPSSPASPRADVREVTPAEARFRQGQGAVLLDVREDDERAAVAEGSVGIPRGLLPTRAAGLVPDLTTPVLLICGTGVRSRLAAATMLDMGYLDVASIAGGFARWSAEGLPLAAGLLDADAANRYARQVILPQVGVSGQARLAASRVAIVGAGGLGAPAMLYLAGAGVGHLTLIDDDRVERSNLHRQVVHTDDRVGMAKVESARQLLQALNPTIDVVAREEKLQASNVETLLAGYDVVIDGADNFAARYLIAAATLHLEIPMVYGAVERFSGQVSVFDPRRDDSPCYRCIYPRPPRPGDVPDCNQAGVLGVIPGTIGLLQATETLKLLLGVGDNLVGRLLTYDALTMRFREVAIPRDAACPGCGAHVSSVDYLAIEGFSCQA